MSDGLPSTFERRGVLVDFNHRLLQNIRLRIPETAEIELKALEAVIQNYSGLSNKHALVLPWLHVPNLAQLGRRDQRLFDTISQYSQLDLLDPFALRLMTLEIDRSDGEDAAARGHAETELAAHRIDRFRAYLGLVANLTRACGRATDDPGLAAIDADVLMQLFDDREPRAAAHAQSLTGRVFTHLSSDTGLEIADLTSRLERLCDQIAPIGVSEPGSMPDAGGHLARAAERMRRFRHQLGDHEKQATEEIANSCLLVIFAVKQYLDLIDNQCDNLAARLGDLPRMILRIDDSARVIYEIRRTLSFAIDGWVPLIDRWDAAAAVSDPDARRDALDATVLYTLQFLPLMPSAVLNPNTDTDRVWRKYQYMRAKPLPQMVNWLDERPDTELIERVENARTRAAQNTRTERHDTNWGRTGRR